MVADPVHDRMRRTKERRNAPFPLDQNGMKVQISPGRQTMGRQFVVACRHQLISAPPPHPPEVLS
jgi:hypothetical protein